jgi:spore germination protein YaaH
MLAVTGMAFSLVGGNVQPAAAAARPPAHIPDPVQGPHARDEANHASRQPNLAPAHSAVIPRQPKAAVSLASHTPAAIAPGGLNREVFGFAPYWALSQSANWNFTLLSTIAYFGLDVDPDGSFHQGNAAWNGWTSQALVDTINRAHQAGDRVVLVIKAFDENTINQIVTNPASTQNAINNTISAIASKSLDGVNVDFEGYVSPSYPNIQTGLTNFVGQLSSQVHQRWPAAQVTVDTYSGSASWDGGLFNIQGLGQVADGLFVMAYDMGFSNLPGQAAPNAPLNGWTYNHTNTVNQYLTKAPASKVILGVPYYGYKWSTVSPDPYAKTTSGAVAVTYAGVADDFACATKLTRSWDGTAQSPWASWWSPPSGDPCGANHNSWRELYYEDANSLGYKYDLVNAANLKGTGMWALGYDGTSPDLWNEIALKFVYPFKGMYALDGYGAVHADGGSAFLQTNAYWYGWKIARSAALLPDGSGGQVLDGFGALHPFGKAGLASGTPYWAGWDIARDVVLLPSSTATQPQGYVLEGFGGLHPFGGAPQARSTAYWPNWDIAKRAVLLSDGKGGYVLDGFGALHPFAVGTNPLPPVITNTAFWQGWDIARDVALLPGSTAASVGGVTLDGFGGVHPFGNAAGPGRTDYWQGWDIARAVRMSPASTAARPQGWVLEGFGGIHPFGGAPPVPANGYWNWDIAVQLLVY